ncbi:Site-specific recombinase XerD [Cohaesibacter marisflavi]|uniref:Site-specific recombinase XerD n=1 Tax=Cohaesibacter marisflavi TaxID=655353 RepID=A0A1I5E5P2_9HYPH|nr:site-specific integrase [Cohaesibacter marisflavi]SFO06633.1 Site-specific recombinase XerD [Cohaesibacter marisflavi]
MPRQAKPPRLLLRKRKGREPVFVILDRGKEVSTGFGPEYRSEAEKGLASYIQSKWSRRKHIVPEDLSIARALTYYAEEHAPNTQAPERIGYAIEALLSFWGNKQVSDISRKTCDAYAKARGVSEGTIRKELGVLKAALHYCKDEEYLESIPPVKMPERPPSKERWLTRSEVAKLLWTARSNPRHRHVAKFILVAVYTGTRMSAILNLEWSPSETAGHIDIDNGVLYRSGSGEARTKKKRTPSRLPRQLRLHARLWKKNSPQYVISFQGRKVQRINTAWRKVCEQAGIENVTRHTLKHTAITWAMQNRADPTHAAGYFATSLETIQRVYLHHHPDFQQSAVSALEGKKR